MGNNMSCSNSTGRNRRGVGSNSDVLLNLWWVGFFSASSPISITDVNVSQMFSSSLHFTLVMSDCRKGGGVSLKELKNSNPSCHSEWKLLWSCENKADSTIWRLVLVLGTKWCFLTCEFNSFAVVNTSFLSHSLHTYSSVTSNAASVKWHSSWLWADRKWSRSNLGCDHPIELSAPFYCVVGTWWRGRSV